MKKTIKIIDLFKKIANGEETPYKIIYNNVEYTYEYDVQDYWEEEHNYLFEKLFCEIETKIVLEIEVEILDEEDFEDIEKLDIEDNAMNRSERYIRKSNNKFVTLSVPDYVLANKINQLIKNQKKIIERLNDVKKEKKNIQR